MTNLIAIDYDQTMVNSIEILNQYINEELGVSSNFDNIENYYSWKNRIFSKDMEGADEKFLAFFSHDTYSKLIQPFEGVREKLQLWKSQGYTIDIVTARNDALMWASTRKQVKELFGDLIDEIHFADHFSETHRSKSEIVKSIGAAVMIEDNYEDATDVAQNAWISTYLLTYAPWNRNREAGDMTHLHMVEDWSQINL